MAPLENTSAQRKPERAHREDQHASDEADSRYGIAGAACIRW